MRKLVMIWLSGPSWMVSDGYASFGHFFIARRGRRCDCGGRSVPSQQSAAASGGHGRKLGTRRSRLCGAADIDVHEAEPNRDFGAIGKPAIATGPALDA